MAKGKVTTIEIEIKVLEYRETGLLAAYSPDLKGLLVNARTERELSQKLPAAITELLEAQGNKVIDVQTAKKTDEELGDFAPPAFIASAHLSHSVT
jgi:hypothetical protein